MFTNAEEQEMVESMRQEKKKRSEVIIYSESESDTVVSVSL